MLTFVSATPPDKSRVICAACGYDLGHYYDDRGLGRLKCTNHKCRTDLPYTALGEDGAYIVVMGPMVLDFLFEYDLTMADSCMWQHALKSLLDEALQRLLAPVGWRLDSALASCLQNEVWAHFGARAQGKEIANFCGFPILEETAPQTILMARKDSMPEYTALRLTVREKVKPKSEPLPKVILPTAGFNTPYRYWGK